MYILQRGVEILRDDVRLEDVHILSETGTPAYEKVCNFGDPSRQYHCSVEVSVVCSRLNKSQMFLLKMNR